MDIRESLHLGVGAVDIAERIGKPCVAQCAGVGEQLIVGAYYIFGVEHVEHAEVGFRGIALEEVRQMSVDKILIAGELGGVVSAHHLVVIRRGSSLKLRNIHHAVVHGRVGKNHAVVFAQGEGVGSRQLGRAE